MAGLPRDPEIGVPPDDSDPDQLLDNLEAAVGEVLDNTSAGASSVPKNRSTARPARQGLTLGERLNKLQSQVMRLGKEIKRLNTFIADRDTVIQTQSSQIASLQNELYRGPQPQLSSTTEPAGSRLLQEISYLIYVAPKQRRYGEELRTFASSLHQICPCAYRYIRELLPLPSPRTVFDDLQELKAAIAAALDETSGPACLLNFLDEYRARNDIPADHPLFCTLGFDAT